MSKSRWQQRLPIAVLCGVCAVLGWAMGGLGQQAPEPQPAVAALRAPAPTAATPVDRTPLIAVAHDGNVTLRVEQQPLEWVLEEIERQSGAAVTRPGKTHETARREACDSRPPAPSSPARDNDVLRALSNGTEAQRHDALLQAQGEGGGVPEAVLKTVYESDASPKVRVLAFEFALQAHAGDAPSLMRALEAARYLPDAAIAQEANKRLEALAREIDASRAAQQVAARQ